MEGRGRGKKKKEREADFLKGKPTLLPCGFTGEATERKGSKRKRERRGVRALGSRMGVQENMEHQFLSKDTKSPFRSLTVCSNT